VPTVLHELAHEWVRDPTTAIHGPEYAGAFLGLVEEFIGADAAAALRRAYRSQRVRWVEM
jgi:putative metallohydrolase (TIGR04338 family)